MKMLSISLLLFISALITMSSCSQTANTLEVEDFVLTKIAKDTAYHNFRVASLANAKIIATGKIDLVQFRNTIETSGYEINDICDVPSKVIEHVSEGINYQIAHCELIAKMVIFREKYPIFKTLTSEQYSKIRSIHKTLHVEYADDQSQFLSLPPIKLQKQ